MPKIEPIPQTLSVSTIRPGRHRPLDQASVKRLAESIREVGILNPIAVRRLDADPGEATFVVVAGDHRLAAAVSIGLRSVPVHVLDLSDLQAQIAGIDENLYRHSLSPAEETAAIAKRKALWEAVHGAASTPAEPANSDFPRAPAPRPSGAPTADAGAKPNVGGRGNKGFAQEMAEQTGMSKRTAHRVAKRAAVLGEAAEEIVGTSLDQPGELDALAAADAKTRADLIQRAKAGEKVSAKPATPEKAKAPAAPAVKSTVEPPAVPPRTRTPEDYVDGLIHALHACATNLSIDEVARYQITGRIGPAERQLIHSLSMEPPMADVQDGLYDGRAEAPRPTTDVPASAGTPTPESNGESAAGRFLHAVGTHTPSPASASPAGQSARRPAAPSVGRWHPASATPDLLGTSAADRAGA